MAPGAGLALSAPLLEYLSLDTWRQCLDAVGGSGERALAKCLWRMGIAFTLPGEAGRGGGGVGVGGHVGGGAGQERGHHPPSAPHSE